jgi:hypothetical protein
MDGPYKESFYFFLFSICREHLEKFLKCIPMNIYMPCTREDGHYAYSLRVRGNLQLFSNLLHLFYNSLHLCGVGVTLLPYMLDDLLNNKLHLGYQPIKALYFENPPTMGLYPTLL